MSNMEAWNARVLDLVQAMSGAVSPNFRMVILSRDADQWVVRFVLEREDAGDREEIEEIEFAFDALQDTNLARRFEVVIDGGPLAWPTPPDRVVFSRRERSDNSQLLELLDIEGHLDAFRGDAQRVGHFNKEQFDSFIAKADDLSRRIRGGLWAPKSLVHAILATSNCLRAEARMWDRNTPDLMIAAANTLDELLLAMLTSRTRDELPKGPRVQ